MKLTLNQEKQVEAKYIQVLAAVRYWDDASVNGESDENGANVPFKHGDIWEPLIDIDNGLVVDWPEGVEVDFHFKVCDSGSYHLLDEDKNILASIINNYVPDGLCHGDRGYGDYIIFSVNGNGGIEKYSNKVDADDWSEEE